MRLVSFLPIPVGAAFPLLFCSEGAQAEPLPQPVARAARPALLSPAAALDSTGAALVLSTFLGVMLVFGFRWGRITAPG